MRHMAFFRSICGKQAFCPCFVSFTQLRRSLQDPQQVSVRIQAVFLRRFNQAVDHAAGLCAARRVGEQPILPAHHKWFHAALGTVVAQLQTAILQIPRQIFAAHVPSSPPHGCSPTVCGIPGIRPRAASPRSLAENARRAPLSSWAGTHTVQWAVSRSRWCGTATCRTCW